jgi:antitoxin (DNA-binding transcriptional repressor) of toxin-antitoxin stability system
MSETPDRPTIVLLSPGLRDDVWVWGEKVVVLAQQKHLQQAFPGARVLTRSREDLPMLRDQRVDLLISYYTGPHPPWRADDVAEHVSGITLLYVVNRPDRLEEFARIPVDGFLTNSRRAAAVLGRARPARYLPLGVDDDLGPVAPDPWYRADVVFLGSGGRGHRRPETIRRYLEPARGFDFDLWGAYWDHRYWADAYRDDPAGNQWHRFWRGPLPLGDIAKLYSSAGIVLGFHEDGQREWGMWNNRVFEALACGALLITDDAAGLREELGEAVEITAGGEETARLVAHYLERPEERRRRGALGRELVTGRYTYSRWAREVRAFYEELRAARSAAAHPTPAQAVPTFTVAMPVFDRTVAVREAIESVLRQTHQDFELILADDGSISPAMATLLDEYRARPQVRVLRLPHRGPGGALNAAVREARARYVCRLDSDDRLVPEALEVMAGYVARHPEVAYFYSSRQVIDADGTVIQANHRSRPFDPWRLLETFICNPLITWKREAFLAVGGFREELYFVEDYDLALRMACRFPFRHVDEFLYQVRYHPAGRITTGLSREQQEVLVRAVQATSGTALRAALTRHGAPPGG